MDGKTIAQFYNTATPSINDAGAIAFLVGFTDGTSGIVMAQPNAAPEPGTLALLGGGAVCAGVQALRRLRGRR